MNKRLLVILGVFAGGFGLGYALTWLLVSNPDAPPPGAGGPAVAAAKAGDAIPTASVPPGAGSGDQKVSGTIPVDPPPGDDGVVPGEDDGAGRGDDGATEPGGDEPGGDPVDGAPGGALAEPVGDDPGDPTDAAPPTDGRPADGPPEDPPPVDAPWWVACKGKTCAMDFGRVNGSVSLRAGEIEDGAEVVWRDTFGKAERVGSVPARDGLRVVLRGVGLQHGLPVAAWISFKDGDTELTGVMALNIGDKVIRMKPIER